MPQIIELVKGRWSLEGAEEKIRGVLVGLSPGARRELLLVLTSPADIRADVIRQFYERPSKQGWAELLIDLEDDELARATVIEILEDLRGRH